MVPSVFTKNQDLEIVSESKKNPAPARPCFKKSLASVAIHLKMLNPAPDFKTNSAIACWMNSPTITVGQGIALRFVDDR